MFIIYNIPILGFTLLIEKDDRPSSCSGEVFCPPGPAHFCWSVVECYERHWANDFSSVFLW